MKVKDIPYGSILWYGNNILGIKGIDLDEKYFDKECRKVSGNSFDYELVKGTKINE